MKEKNRWLGYTKLAPPKANVSSQSTKTSYLGNIFKKQKNPKSIKNAR